jgi:NitT/TauT family transport system ATP-binding protein
MLNISHLTKNFDDLPVLRDLNLSVASSEIVSLIGPSGCGKSTLLNIISGLEVPDSGAVTVHSDRLSYMFQNARLLPWRSVYDNIRLVREDAPPEEIRRLIHSVGLDGFENYYPGQLSGGMAKRCALARAFHFGGDLLLMDEPFQGLDYGLRMEMLKMLLSIWRQRHQGVLFVTHEIDEALTVATRIAVLSARPTTVQEVITLPGAEGRDASDPELLEIRRHIIHAIAQ